MDEQSERRLRRKAIRLHLRGLPVTKILKAVQRSKAWFSKWSHRFEQFGTAGLKSRSRRPHHQPTASASSVVWAIVRTRRRLVRQRIGLIGPRAIQREFERLGDVVPSLTTIKRILPQRGLIPTAPVPSYYPRPLEVLAGVLHALDWTCRYLEAGVKVYAFHTLNLRTRACVQPIAADKQGQTVIAHLLQTWQTLGIPAFLQLDNDAAFCGGYKTPRRIGQVVRLCLYLGIELIFLPVAEPERNGEVEELNGLWSRAFWQRQRFRAVRHVQRASPRFIHWYATSYAPPALVGKTPAQAQRAEHSQRLTPAQVRRLPETLPITAGRIHFIRRVQPDGTIAILSETWQVGRRFAGRYAWATITTYRHHLDMWYQRSAQADWRLIKSFAYPLPEQVKRRKPEFRQPANG
jgi:putative transposase